MQSIAGGTPYLKITALCGDIENGSFQSHQTNCKAYCTVLM